MLEKLITSSNEIDLLMSINNFNKLKMKRENLKPSIITYYQTRASIIHPILAITQVNIGIYLLFASPYINTRFITVSFKY